MKVLVLNCGSSSVKYKLLDMPRRETLAQGNIEKVTSNEHAAAIRCILDRLLDRLKDQPIDAVGHRIVHGGETFSQSVRITPDVIQKIADCIALAPLHNPPNLEGIRAIQQLLPNLPQVAVFDTAFHQSIPNYAYLYGLPYRFYEQYAIRRYGFHGTSHRYVTARACQILHRPYNRQRIISAHIGNGASITAIKNGVSVDTSMGLTPVEGLLMGTRCGDVDAGALLYLMEKEGLNAQTLSELINRQSGLLGLSGVSSDMREIDAAIANGNQRAILARDAYNYRIKKYIGAYAAALEGVDILVFTGGVGENQISARQAVCSGLEFIGIRIDPDKNNIRGQEAIISTPDSPVAILVVPTDEEYLIAADTLALLT